MSGQGTQYTSSVPPEDEIEVELPFEQEEEEEELDPVAEKQRQIEAEAHRMGWRPKEEYRGPPGGWRTAEEFLKRGESILPMVRKDLIRERERVTKMSEEIQALRQTVDEQKASMEDLLRMARTADERGYKRGVEELQARKRQAAAEGDVATVVAIDEQLDEVREARAANKPVVTPPKAAEAPKNPAAKLPREVEQFIADNPWFNTDGVLHRAMEAEHMALLEESPAMPLEENLERAKEIVMARYPRKFGITDDAPPSDPPRQPVRRTGVSAPTAPAGGGRVKATGIASIEDPTERAAAQLAFNRIKRQIPDITETEWFAVYQNPKVDVMDMRQAAKKKVTR